MLRIGEFARHSGLSIDTLRHYDAIGLLRPAGVDTASGYRYYDHAQLAQAYRIMALKDAGFTLAEITRLQTDDASTQALTGMLERKAMAMQVEVARQQDRLARLLSSIFRIKNGGIPHMNEVMIKSVEPIWVCAIRREIPKGVFDSELEAMWPAVNAHIASHGVQRTTPCLMLYHDGTWEHKGETLDIEVAEPVLGTLPEAGEIRAYDLPAVARMACTVHRGPFATIPEAYARLLDWMAQNGYPAKGPLREIYHKGDWLTDDPQEYVTELQIPIE